MSEKPIELGENDLQNITDAFGYDGLEEFEGIFISTDGKKDFENKKQHILEALQNNKKLKEFLVKKIAELDQRISKWSNFTQSGQSQYSMVSLRLDTYKEILSEITGVSV